MQISEARLNELKPSLVKELEWLPDADPNVLADYIIKLMLRGDKDEESLFNSCVNSLEGFLKEGTRDFVSSFFSKLRGEKVEVENVVSNQKDREEIENLDYEEEDYGKRGNGFNKKERNYENNDRRRGSNSSSNRRRSGGARGASAGGVDGRSRNNSICRDFKERGYCLKGEDCPYSHQEEMQSVNGENGHEKILSPAGLYSALSASRDEPQRRQRGPPSTTSPYSNRPSRKRYTNNHNHNHNYNNNNDGSSLSSPAVNYAYRSNRSMNVGNTNLVVEKIPETFFNESAIMEHFQKFGSILNLQLLQSDAGPNNAKAILEFATHEEADAAYQSPEVIFNNRFVKVYWYKSPEQLAALSSSSSPHGSRRNTPGSMSRKADDPMRAFREYQQKKEALLQKQLEQEANLKARLADPNIGNEEKTALEAILQSVSENIVQLRGSADAVASPKNRPMNRAINAAAIGTKSLRVDNRPRSLRITGIPDSVKTDIEHIKRLFSTFGIVERVMSVGDDVAIVVFSARWEAEKALVNHSKLVDIGSLIQASWYLEAVPDAPDSSNISGVIVEDDGDDDDDDEDDVDMLSDLDENRDDEDFRA